MLFVDSSRLRRNLIAFAAKVVHYCHLPPCKLLDPKRFVTQFVAQYQRPFERRDIVQVLDYVTFSRTLPHFPRKEKRVPLL